MRALRGISDRLLIANLRALFFVRKLALLSARSLDVQCERRTFVGAQLLMHCRRRGIASSVLRPGASAANACICVGPAREGRIFVGAGLVAAKVATGLEGEPTRRYIVWVAFSPERAPAR